MNKKALLMAVFVLILVGTACKLPFVGSKATPTAKPAATEAAPPPGGGGQAEPTRAPQAPQATKPPEAVEPTEAPLTEPTEAPVPTQPSNPPATSGNPEFPMPDGAENVMQTGEMLNYQVKGSLKDVLAWYRESYAKMNFPELTLYQAITDAAFSVVFDGSKTGKQIVIQGVDLSNGTVNINIRYEKLK